MATNSEVIAFIKKMAPMCIAECNNRIAEGRGFVLPSVAMAQASLECNWGTAGIMTKANAFFGIKAGGSWTGKVYSASTWEVVEGEVHNITANFRAYDRPEDSVKDYYDMIERLSRYKDGLSYGNDRSKWLSAYDTIVALWRGGYATDEIYPQKIMNTINGRDLTQYDSKVTGVGSTDPGGTYYPPHESLNFTKESFVTGHLYVGDSGRSLLYGAQAVGSTTGLPLITITGDTTFTLEGIEDIEDFKMALLRDDTASIIALTEGQTVNVLKDDQIGFNFHNTVLADIPTDLNITLTANVIGGTVNLDSAIAYFVEIKS